MSKRDTSALADDLYDMGATLKRTAEALRKDDEKRPSEGILLKLQVVQLVTSEGDMLVTDMCTLYPSAIVKRAEVLRKGKRQKSTSTSSQKNVFVSLRIATCMFYSLYLITLLFFGKGRHAYV